MDKKELFKLRVNTLISLDKAVKKLEEQNKITLRQMQNFRKVLSKVWDIAYDDHPNVSDSIKEAFRKKLK